MMPASGRARLVLVFALAVLGVSAVAVLTVPAPLTGDAPSSRNAGRGGGLALYTWLETLGFQVHRLSSGFDLTGTDVLLSLAPTDGYGQDEVAAVMDHLARGGDVVISLDQASNPGQAQPLLDRLGVTAAGAVDAGSAVPAQPIDAGGRVTVVPLGTALSLTGSSGVVPLLLAGRRPVAVAVRSGLGGRAYVVGSNRPFSNEGLRAGDSAGFMLTLLERARGGRIAFDEFHHGEGRRAIGASAIVVGPIGLSALLGGILVLSYLAITGRRLGRPLEPAATARAPSMVVYVDAVAQLYGRSRRRGGVAARYGDELKRRIGAAAAVDSRLNDRDFLSALRGRGRPDVDRVRELLDRARRLSVGEPSEAQVIDLARTVDAAERDGVSPAPRPGPVSTMPR